MLSMRVLIINTSERIGGAAIAANRLMEALKNNGVNAKMLVRDKQSSLVSVVPLPSSWKLPAKFIWERFVIWLSNGFSRNNLFQMDIANTGTDITSMSDFRMADVVHLHWVNQGFLSLDDITKILRSGKPVVFTMHDMWYFTGVCHYSGDCQKYRTGCGLCPFIHRGGAPNDMSARVFRRKLKMYSDSKLRFVACSRWLENLAKKSRLLEGQFVTNIPNAINTNLFRPEDKAEARRRCGLPEGKRLLLFGCQKITDERKGFKYLVDACRILKEKYPAEADNIGLVVAGAESDKVQNYVPFTVYPIDYVSDEAHMVDLYNAVDLYVTPSLQDNLPNTIVEAMSCGVPCVGFAVGGIPEMIDHLHNGYVAYYKDAADFANGIHWALDGANYANLCEMARRKAVDTYAEDEVARRYIEIYNSALGGSASSEHKAVK